MPRGGSRPGAGRRHGSKANVARALARQQAVATAEQIIGDGLTPLEYMISVMRDERAEKKVRLDAARAAADYVHRRQPQAVEVDSYVPIAVQIITPLTQVPHALPAPGDPLD